MKKSLIILFVACIITGCGPKQLDKQVAFDVIKKGLGYPRLLDYDIYCGDPEYARKIQKAGLDKGGLVTVSQTQKLSEVGKPLIQFSPKAQTYLLSTDEKDKALSIQKVKLADEDILEIVSIGDDKNSNAKVVEYTTGYKSVTPFASLINQDFTATKSHKAYLSIHDGSWQIEKTKGH